jgi:hypothetical protein
MEMTELHLIPGEQIDAGGTWPVVKVGIPAAGEGKVQLFVREQDRDELDRLIEAGDWPLRWVVDSSLGRATVFLLEQVARDTSALLHRFRQIRADSQPSLR